MVLYISRHYSFQTYESTNFISIYDGVLLTRLQNALGALLMLFGYIPDRSVLSLRGLISIISFLLIGLFIYCTVKCFRRTEGSSFFVVLFLITAFFVNCFAFVFTTSTLVPRYYITVFVFVLPVLCFYFTKERLLFDKAVTALLLAGCLLLSTGKTVLSEITVDKNAAKRPVAEFLAETAITSAMPPTITPTSSRSLPTARWKSPTSGTRKISMILNGPPHEILRSGLS